MDQPFVVTESWIRTHQAPVTGGWTERALTALGLTPAAARPGWARRVSGLRLTPEARAAFEAEAQPPRCRRCGGLVAAPYWRHGGASDRAALVWWCCGRQAAQAPSVFQP